MRFKFVEVPRSLNLEGHFCEKKTNKKAPDHTKHLRGCLVFRGVKEVPDIASPGPAPCEPQTVPCFRGQGDSVGSSRGEAFVQIKDQHQAMWSLRQRLYLVWCWFQKQKRFSVNQHARDATRYEDAPSSAVRSHAVSCWSARSTGQLDLLLVVH